MPANVVRDPEHLWQRVRDGLPAAVIGRLPECPPDVALVCVGCEAADEREPLVITRRVLLALLGEVEAAKKPTRSRAKKAAEPAADEALAELLDRVGQQSTSVLVLGGVEAAAPEVRATLVQLLARADGAKLPVIFRFAAVGGAEELLAAVRGRGGEEAVFRREAMTAAELRRLPVDVVQVLRAGARLGGEFLVGDVAKLLGCGVLEVLERLQTAVDLGVEVEDRGGRFALAGELVAALAVSLMPALAQAWDERLAWLAAGTVEPAVVAAEDVQAAVVAVVVETPAVVEVVAEAPAVEPAAVAAAAVPVVVVPEVVLMAPVVEPAAVAAAAVPVVVVPEVVLMAPVVEPAAVAAVELPEIPVVVVPEVVLVVPVVEPTAVASVELPEWVTEVADDAPPVAVVDENVSRGEAVEEVATSAGEPAAVEEVATSAGEPAAVDERERRDAVEDVAASASEPAAAEESERQRDVEDVEDAVASTGESAAVDESERRGEVEAAVVSDEVAAAEIVESAVVPAVVDDVSAERPAAPPERAASVSSAVDAGEASASAGAEAPAEAGVAQSDASRAEVAAVEPGAEQGAVEAEAGAGEDMSEETAVSDEELVDGDLEEVPEAVPEASWQAGEMFVRGRRRPGSGASPPRLRPKPPRIASLKARAEDKEGKGEAKLPTRNPALEVAARLKNVPQPMEVPEVAEARVAEDSRKAGDPLAAAEHYTRAAHEAAEMGAPKVALGHVQQALSLLQGLPRTPERRRVRGEALLELGQLQWQSSAPELGFSLAQALTTLEAAAAELGSSAPTAVAVQLCQAIAGVCFERGDAKSLVRALQELASASRMLLAEGDQTGAARLLNDQAAVLVRMGDPVQALHLLRESRKVFQARSEEDPVALRELAETDHLFARLPLHAEMRAGRELEGYRAGLSHAQKAERAYRQLGDARELGRVWETMGRLELKMEQLETATKHLESAVDVQMQLGDLTGLARSTEALSEVLGLRGRDGEAINLLRESVQFNRNKGSPLGLSINRRVFTVLAERLRAHPLHAPALHDVEVLLAAGERELGTVDGGGGD